MKKLWPTILVICIALLWLSLGYTITSQSKSGGKSDFAVYYAAAQAVAGHAHLTADDIYHQSTFRSLVREYYLYGGTYFLYTPSTAVLLTPLTVVSFKIAVELWRIVNICLFVIMTLLWLRFLGLPLKRYSWLLLILAAAPPLFSNIDTGQINLIVFALLTVVWAGLIYQRYPKLVGIALGLATMVKVFPILFFGYLVLKKQYVAALSTIITLVVLVLLSLPVVGVSTWQLFLSERLPELMASKIGYTENSISLYGSLRTVLLHLAEITGYRLRELTAITDPIYQGFIVVFGLGLSLYLWLKRKLQTRPQLMLEVSLLTLFILLMPKIVHQHYLIWLIPTLLWLWSQLKNKTWWWIVLLSAGTILVLFQKYLPFLGCMDIVIKPVTFGLILITISLSLVQTTSAKYKR